MKPWLSRLNLPVSDVGLVQLNQKVKVRLAGAISVEYDVHGVVGSISPDTMKNQNSEEFYQVKILLDTGSVCWRSWLICSSSWFEC